MLLIAEYCALVALINMYVEKGSQHKKPHVHAKYTDKILVIAADGEILAGGLPKKQQKYVEAWVALREEEIRATWDVLNDNGEVLKIKGLEA